MKNLLLLFIVIAVAFFAQYLNAREVELPTRPKYTVTINDTVSVWDLPFEYAKNLPDDLWFEWARRHNEKQYQQPRVAPTPSVIQDEITTDYTGNIFTTGRANTRATTRVFYQQEGRLPATIYNPYAR